MLPTPQTHTQQVRFLYHGLKYIFIHVSESYSDLAVN